MKEMTEIELPSVGDLIGYINSVVPESEFFAQLLQTVCRRCIEYFSDWIQHAWSENLSAGVYAELIKTKKKLSDLEMLNQLAQQSINHINTQRKKDKETSTRDVIYPSTYVQATTMMIHSLTQYELTTASTSTQTNYGDSMISSVGTQTFEQLTTKQKSIRKIPGGGSPMQGFERDVLSNFKKEKGGKVLPAGSPAASVSKTLMPTGNVTLVFSDVQHSTFLWNQNTSAMHEALQVHNNIFRTVMSKFSGYEVKTEGDAFMISFQHAMNGANCCMTVQMQLLEADWPAPLLEYKGDTDIVWMEDEHNEPILVWRGLRVRMGLHTGDPICDRDPVTGRMDYFGPVVNYAARVAGNGRGGEIVMDTASHANLLAIASQGGPDCTFITPPFTQELGNFSLKGFDGEVLLMQFMPYSLRHRSIDLPAENKAAQEDEGLAGSFMFLQNAMQPAAMMESDATIVMTEVSNCSPLWEIDKKVTQKAMSTCTTVLRAMIRKYSGREIKHAGDAMILVFPFPTAALGFCLSTQRLLLHVDWEPELLAMHECVAEVYSTGHKTVKEKKDKPARRKSSISLSAPSVTDGLIWRGLRMHMSVGKRSITRGIPSDEPVVLDTEEDLLEVFGQNTLRHNVRMLAAAHGGEVLMSSDVFKAVKGNEYQIVEGELVTITEVTRLNRHCYRAQLQALQARNTFFVDTDVGGGQGTAKILSKLSLPEMNKEESLRKARHQQQSILKNLARSLECRLMLFFDYFYHGILSPRTPRTPRRVEMRGALANLLDASSAPSAFEATANGDQYDASIQTDRQQTRTVAVATFILRREVGVQHSSNPPAPVLPARVQSPPPKAMPVHAPVEAKEPLKKKQSMGRLVTLADTPKKFQRTNTFRKNLQTQSQGRLMHVDSKPNLNMSRSQTAAKLNKPVQKVHLVIPEVSDSSSSRSGEDEEPEEFLLPSLTAKEYTEIPTFQRKESIRKVSEWARDVPLIPAGQFDLSTSLEKSSSLHQISQPAGAEEIIPQKKNIPTKPSSSLQVTSARKRHDATNVAEDTDRDTPLKAANDEGDRHIVSSGSRPALQNTASELDSLMVKSSSRPVINPNDFAGRQSPEQVKSRAPPIYKTSSRPVVNPEDGPSRGWQEGANSGSYSARSDRPETSRKQGISISSQFYRNLEAIDETMEEMAELAAQKLADEREIAAQRTALQSIMKSNTESISRSLGKIGKPNAVVAFDEGRQSVQSSSTKEEVGVSLTVASIQRFLSAPISSSVAIHYNVALSPFTSPTHDKTAGVVPSGKCPSCSSEIVSRQKPRRSQSARQYTAPVSSAPKAFTGAACVSCGH